MNQDSCRPPGRGADHACRQGARQPAPCQVDPAEAARNIARRFREASLRHAHLEDQARTDVRRLVRMITHEFHPQRIYQWGSLTRQGVFREFSDIDLAVEGVTDPGLFFKMLGRCMESTDFPVDIVQMECLDPLHAAEIRAQGRLLWEAPRCLA